MARTLKQRIADLKRSAASFRGAAQEIALDIIASAQQHGDASLALDLVKAMGEGVKQSAMIAFFGRFSPIGVDLKANDGAGKVWLRKETTRSGAPNPAFRDFDMEGAKECQWWTCKPATKPETALTLDAYRSLIRKALAKALTDEEGVLKGFSGYAEGEESNILALYTAVKGAVDSWAPPANLAAEPPKNIIDQMAETERQAREAAAIEAESRKVPLAPVEQPAPKNRRRPRVVKALADIGEAIAA